MASALINTYRLAKAGLVFARHGVRFVPKGVPVPTALRLAAALTAPIGWLSAPFRIGQPKAQRLTAALTNLGPSYIKLGQFLATRADLIGPELARDLSHLQDRLPAFSDAEARATVERELGGKLEDYFVWFGPPVAAASIAQVHKAEVIDNGMRRQVAVKILRPDVEKRFRRDLDSYAFAARQAEAWYPPARRLRPRAVVENLKRTTELEMDLRLEAAAISEMADNFAKTANQNPPAFRVPTVDWKRTRKRVMTIEWIDGTPISNHASIEAQGFDRRALGLTVIQSFLRHAMRDGFFHGDMHQGNLFIDQNGTVVAVDFGIMGRIGPRERRFLAEVLHGLITRDYRRAADIHFQLGYVPPHHDVAVFAQAMRAIGEPIHGRTASEISMADLLGQLFAYTDVFDMETRPELILMQKSMVIVEGVARGLDPELNMWVAAEPVAREWIEDNLGAIGRLRDAGEGAGEVAKLLADVPRLVHSAERAAIALGDMTASGLRLDDATVSKIARLQSRGRWKWTLALWTGAAALAAIALAQWPL
ncbi:MAG: 2-polyprenylphenol 6-hydroxylase [Hyphomicrobiaceae bacterium]|nr:2-polyprenylphenol 6-hydroxylase [Hyphomicrobiaceae bacterium]